MKLLTYEDYAAFPDDGIRREIIGGKVYVMASPTVRHQDLIGRLYVIFWQHIRTEGRGRVFLSPLDVLLDIHDIVEPDLIYVADDRADIITEPNLKGSPTLLIEILSNPRTDRLRKKALYDRTGVPEYWIVDPKKDRVEVYRLAAGGYGEPAFFEPGDTLEAELLPGLQIDVATLLAR